MHDTLPNVVLPNGGEWINIYDTLGIAIGTPLTIKSLSANSAKISIQSASPGSADGHQLILKGQSLILDSGNSGVWASSQSGGSINVATVIDQGIKVDATGTQRVSNDFSLFRSYFTFDVPPSLWSIEEDGVEVRNDLSTRVTSLNGHVDVTSGAAPGNKSLLDSRRHPRYQPNRGLRLSASIGFKDANLDGLLKAGLFVADENGAYFKTKGDGKLYACILKDGVETKEEEIIFPFPIDITLGNIFTIQILWHGVGAVKYYVDNPRTGFPELVHTISFINQLDEDLYFHNPALNVAYSAENITQEVSLWSGSVDVSAEGGQRDNLQYGSNSAEVVVSATTNNGILAMRSPNTIGGKRNTRDMRLVRISLQTDKKSKIKLYQTRDSTAIAAGTWNAPVFGSFVEFNSTMTSVDPAKMAEFLTIDMPANVLRDLDNPDKDVIDFIIVHGDIIVIALDSGSAVGTTATIEYGEEI